ncbi:MAG: hypothetical protein JWP97_1242 [Labilithrix sp.]|nr:hypothetical protein [Labilithrix sp.]
MSVTRITPAEAHAKMTGESFTYVDVRTEEEFAAGHPAGAFNVPISITSGGALVPNPEFVAHMEKAFPKDAPLILGCKTGARSARAGQMLEDAGFTTLLDQTAGWEGKKGSFGETVEAGWSKASLPVEEGHPEGRSYASLAARSSSSSSSS